MLPVTALAASPAAAQVAPDRRLLYYWSLLFIGVFLARL
jgi:hypothetical protein